MRSGAAISRLHSQPALPTLKKPHGDIMTTRRSVVKLCALWPLAHMAGTAWGASDISPNMALTLYTGADRAERIQRAARDEGELNFYTSIAQSDIAALVDPVEE